MRNIILATALLFTAGIAYAQEATEADATEAAAPEAAATATTETVAVKYPTRPSGTPTRVIGLKTGREFFELKNIVEDDNVTGYYWDVTTQHAGWKPNDPNYPFAEKAAMTKQNGGWYNLSSTLVRYDTDSFAYTVFDASNNTEWEAELSVATDPEGNVDMENSKNLIGYRDVYEYKNVKDEVTGITHAQKTDNLIRRVYYFAVPIDKVEVEYWQKDSEGNLVLDEENNPIALEKPIVNYPVTKLGVKVKIDDEDAFVSSIENPADPNLFYIVDGYQNGKTGVEGKNYYLAFGDSANAEKRSDPEIAFGQPLPAPFATLLIALCFGAAFVIYRNRKQAA